MPPQPAPIEDDEYFVVLDGPPLIVRTKPHPPRSSSPASSDSSCKLRSDSNDDSVIIVEPKRRRLASSMPSGKSHDDREALEERSLESHQQTIGMQTPRKRAHPESSEPGGSQNRTFSGAGNFASPPRMNHAISGVDAQEYVQLHPDAKVEDGCVLIEVEGLEEEMEEEILRDEALSQPITSPRRGFPLRNCPIALPWVKRDSVRHGISTLKAGKTVELDNGNFLFIIDVVKNLESDIDKLRGWQLRRCTDMGGVLRKAMNEICFIFEVELDDPRPVEIQSMIEVELGHVVKVRELVRTNYPFPYLRFSEDIRVSDDKSTNMQFARNNVRLVVRWKKITMYENRAQRLRAVVYPIHIVRTCLISLTEQECTEGCYLDLLVKRSLWRPETIAGGSGVKEQQVNSSAGNEEFGCPACRRVFQGAEVLFEHYQTLHRQQRNGSSIGKPQGSHSAPSQPHAPRNLSSLNMRDHSSKSNHDQLRRMASDLKVEPAGREQMYTFADTFCGAGGTTRAAVMAGLLLLWGLDKDGNSGKTWRCNFPKAKHYEMWADEFVGIDEPSFSLITDVLHMSPPCQVWSPVHARPGKNDEQNFSSLFACEELLKKAKPRMVTLEQTFGILHPKFAQSFNSLVQMFTFHDYSISWELVDLQSYGLPQRRRRLIILAAAPGESLPELPARTHSEFPRPGLKPLRSVNSALNTIPFNAPRHDVAQMLARGTSKRACDGRKIATCIMTNGGEKSHPSGLRNFTICELAALQTFPLHHIFHGSDTDARKQIGNAVPPLVAKVIFRAIIRHLEKTDGISREVEILD